MTLQGDLKESFVEVSHPSSPPVDERSISSTHQLAGPANHILISRTFAALKGPMQFTVDPNILLPRSLLPKRDPYTPLQNLELYVGLAKVEADVTVLPFAPDSPPQREREEDLETYQWRIRNGYRLKEHKKVLIKAGTGTRNMTLRVNAPEGTPIVMKTWSTFGHVRLFLPRSITGPLVISSWLRAACFSLQRVCSPLHQASGEVHWFVGDMAAWRGKDECGDEVRVGSMFGTVWVGYVGEEAEAQRAMRLGVLGMTFKGLWVSFLLWVLYGILLSVVGWVL